MYFSEINIQDLIRQKTTEFLTNSVLSYDTLRFYMLDKKPIPEVQSEIDNCLTTVRKTNKQTIREELLAHYITTQKQHDFSEEQDDARQLLEDNTERTNLHAELKKNQLFINSHIREIDETEQKIRQLEHQLAIFKQASTVHHQHHYPQAIAYIEGSSNQHHHGPTSVGNTNHHHSHIPSFEGHHHSPSNSIDNFSHQGELLLTQQLCAYKDNLISHLSEKKNLEQYARTRQEKFNEQYKKNQLQRQKRASERAIRAHAISTKATISTQLSAKIYASFQEVLESDFRTIDGLYYELKSIAEEKGYSFYLTVLNDQLPTMQQIDIASKTALTQMNQYLQKYLQEKDLEKKNRAILDDQQEKLLRLNRYLTQNQQQLKTKQENTAHLQNQIRQLTNENQTLNRAIQERQSANKRLFIYGISDLFITAALTSLPIILLYLTIITASSLLFPLLFIPAAIGTLVLLGIGASLLIKGVKNIFYRNQQKQNERKIHTNESVIQHQDEARLILENGTISVNRREIQETENVILKTKEELDFHTQTADLHFNKAARVIPYDVTNSELFDKPASPPPHYSDYSPSAPPLPKALHEEQNVDESDGKEKNLYLG